jgi:hypothetical protein
MPSLAIGSVAFSPLDMTGNTLFAGTGSFSSLGSSGGLAVGVLRTTDGGNTWINFPLNPGNEPRIRTILPTAIDLDPGPGLQQVILAGAIQSGGGLYRSDDNGETFTNISGMNGLPSGSISHVIVDPNDSMRFYAAVSNSGVYRGDFDPVDDSLDWTAVNNGMSGLGTAGNIQLAAHDGGANTVLFSLVSGSSRGAFRSTNDGDNWTALATPPMLFERNVIERAANTMEADPVDDEVVYITTYGGGDDIFRYDPTGPAWVLIDQAGAKDGTAPHADGRDLAFLGNDVLLDANDGGFYFIKNPMDALNNRWQSFIGETVMGDALGPVEVHNVAWDSTFDVAVIGTQDNGTSVQMAAGDLVWDHFRGGDGGDVQVDTVNAGAGQTFRYTSTQNFGLTRHTFDSATNQPVASVGLVPMAGLHESLRAGLRAERREPRAAGDRRYRHERGVRAAQRGYRAQRRGGQLGGGAHGRRLQRRQWRSHCLRRSAGRHGQRGSARRGLGKPRICPLHRRWHAHVHAFFLPRRHRPGRRARSG